MTCVRCGGALADSDERCPECGAFRGTAPDAPTSISAGLAGVESAAWPVVGREFGSRYRIIELLGSGGMGTVFHAWDKTAEVDVALKVIRAPLAQDADVARSLDRRFKRELQLARQVTHKHVVRIHDLGEVDDIRYITMPFVRGLNLSQVLAQRGRLPVAEAMAITRQIASGLAAAHDAGIVHRDLKPANIMIDADGQALIMDFGIARSTSGGTGVDLTASNAVVGTIEYMAPEQARAGPIDHRADIYALGLIVREMLVGRRAPDDGSAIAELIARMQHPPAPMRATDDALPEWIDAVVTRCLQPDPAARYQTVLDLAADIDGATATLVATRVSDHVAPRRAGRALAIAGLALALVLGVSAWLTRAAWWPVTDPAPANTTPISLAVLPFRNASGDASLDSLGTSVGHLLASEFGQSSRVRVVPIDRVHQILRDLRVTTSEAVPPEELARIADFTNARHLLVGQLTRFGPAIRIDAVLHDLDRGSNVPVNVSAADDGSVLASVSTLADAVRQALGKSARGVVDELRATSWKPSTSSLTAFRLYSEGMDLVRQGSHQEARKQFEASVREDSRFALAFSALARTCAELGYDAEATGYSNQAMSLSEALPAPEKYLIAATHHRLADDVASAIEAYENLVQASPNNSTTRFDLAGLYEQSGNLEKAREHLVRAVDLDPKFAEGLLALGRVDIRRGEYQNAMTPLSAALALAIQFSHDEVRANILQAIGIAYKRMDRLQDALRHYEQSLEIKRRLGNKRGMGASLGEIAQVLERLGEGRKAEATVREALAIQREIGNRAGIATALVNLGALLNETLGEPGTALPLFQEALRLRRESGNAIDEALVLNNIGSAYLSQGQHLDAQTHFERALEIREKHEVPPDDLADTLHNLGETMIRTGQFEKALEWLHRALELRRKSGNARWVAVETAVIGQVFALQGRVGAAVKSGTEALAAYPKAGESDTWLGIILSSVGLSLAQAGRFTDAETHLTQAANATRALQNASLVATVLAYQGETALLMGDPGRAKALEAQVKAAAAKAPDPDLKLAADMLAASIEAQSQPSRALAARVGTFLSQSEARGLKAVGAACMMLRAEILVASGDLATARTEVDRALARADQLGMRIFSAKGHFLRAELLRRANGPSAAREYGLALEALTAIRNEEGGDSLFKRADLNAIRAASERWSKG